MKTPADVLDFWYSDEARARWFKSTPEFDAEIVRRFGDTAESISKGPFPHPVWEETPKHALALIILLDQFPRNMYRGSAHAFEWDPISLAAAVRLVEAGGDLALGDPDERKFAYMPFMHAENLMAQNRCVELCGSRLNDDGSTLRHAIAHRDVIERFGRFPHRNVVLGRESTPEEIEFLENGGYNPS